MAFPTTGLLDDFDRANEGPPPSANWTGGIIGFAVGDGLEVNSGRLAGNASANNDGYWNVSTFGPNCECWMTIAATLANTGAWQECFCRLTDIGNGTSDGYLVRARFANPLSSSTLQILKITNGAYSSIGSPASTTVELAAGDMFGIAAIGSSIQGWYKPVAGSWTQFAEATDTDYTTAGYIGALLRASTTHRADDFSGGTIVSVTSGRRYKRFYGPALLVTSAATLYTVPTGCRAIIDHIRLVNNTSSPVDVTMSIGADAAGTRIWDSLTLAADASKSVKGPFTLEAAEIFQAFAGTGSAVTISVYGWQDCL